MNKTEELKKVNSEIKKCNQCRLSETRINAICGEGNVDAKFFIIAQAPGKQEDLADKMFVGPTGKVFDEVFKKINLERNEVYMTNLIKCNLPKNRKPKQKEIETCSQYLDKEIKIISPEFLIPLGYYATKYIFRRYCDEDISSSNPMGKLYFCDGIKIYPVQHPTSIIFNPSNKEIMVNALKKTDVFKNNCKWYPVCPMKRYYEEGKLDRKWIELYCKGDWENCVRYQMEETGQYHPDNMLPNGEICEKLR